jgi:hydroxymethylbilane synthase
MIQAQLAADALAGRYPQHRFVLEPLETHGDRTPAMPLTEASQEGVFVKELEQALLEGRAELAVHSAKDLPTSMTAGLVLCAFLPRGDARDVLISSTGRGLEGLARGARVGTGSPRRAAQLAALRPDLKFLPIRGNVDTRLKKLRDGAVDAVVLAAAGVERLGRIDEIDEIIPFDVMLPAPGQGALALQAKSGTEAVAIATALDDQLTSRAVRAERAVLEGLGGGCLSAVGAYAFVDGDQLVVSAVVLAEDGGKAVRTTARGVADRQVVDQVTSKLKAEGAAGLIRPRSDRLPLAGLRVLVTRASKQAGGLVEALTTGGATVVTCPVIEIEAIPIEPGRLKDLAGYEWLVFTSVNGVEQFLRLAKEMGVKVGARTRIAAIGPETAAELRRRGLTPEIVPEQYVAEELAEAFPRGSVEGKRVLLPRAAGSRDVLPERLRALGATVDLLETYRAVEPANLRSQLQGCLEKGIDVVTFTSSSAVRHFVDAMGGRSLAGATRVACIGPITAGTARELGLRVDIIAEEYTARGLADALVRDHVVRV